MTANELADNLEFQLDRAFAGASPGYEADELSQVLTNAQWHYIKKFIDSIGNRKLSGFEEIEARRQGFSALIEPSTLTVSANQDGVLPNGIFYDLPDDFMFLILENIYLDVEDCVTQENLLVDVFPVRHDEFKRYRKNVYKRPYANGYEGLVWRMTIGREVDFYDPTITATAERVEVITDGTFAITEYDVRYLKLPTPIVVDRDTPANQRHCILNAATHETIVEIARDLMLNIVKEQKLENQADIENYE